ncbi:glycosyltransferase family 2 protein [Paenibacillus pini]|uniref:Glycosyltransferase n=1 Tax=Paenibacillus pini JCM 16418 TaxID=1236976 RepID=W7YU39_9BACL|nr:glycosyltransferase family 2 protein [Paenibacillus pini]GAF08076.1 glycosyltransferase [Paenibacillus pini JCM 16418]
MNNAPLVIEVQREKESFSIVTVCMNNLEGLQRTWESVNIQELQEWEWIVVDGQSNDGTLLFLKSLQDSRVTYISEPDDGLYDAMNKGIELCSGLYILFLNSGDTLESRDVLRLLEEQAIRHQLPDILYGDSLELTDDQQLLYKKARSHRTIWYGMFTHHQSIMYLRSRIRNIRYRLEYPIGADYGFTAELMISGAVCVYVPIPVCIFEQGGISSVNHIRGETDQWYIRQHILRTSWLTRMMIRSLHFGVRVMKNKLPKYYKKVRFSYGKQNSSIRHHHDQK